MKKTKKLSVGRIVGAALMAILLVFTIVLNALALTQFDNIFEQFFGAMPNPTRSM